MNKIPLALPLAAVLSLLSGTGRIRVNSELPGTIATWREGSVPLLLSGKKRPVKFAL